MPDRATGLGVVVGAVIAHLAGDAQLTAIVGDRMWDEMPAGTPRPALRVELLDEEDHDTIGRAGIDAVVQILILSDYRGDAQIGAIARRIRTRLESPEQRFTVAGFVEPADVTYERTLPGFVAPIGGMPVRHRPVWYRVRVN